MAINHGLIDQSGNPRRRSTPLKTVVLAVTIAAFFWSVQTNAYPLHNGDYAFWQSMPPASQVLADVKGTSDLDTAAHRHAALTLLIALVNISADGTGQLPWPPRQRALNAEYFNALPGGNGDRDAMQAQSLRLQADQSFTRPFLRRYFSQPALDEIAPMLSTIESNAQKQIDRISQQTQAGQAYVNPQETEEQEFNSFVWTYSAVCAFFILVWLVRILRSCRSIRTTSDDPPRFEGAWRGVQLYSFTGQVSGSATRSTTSISGGIKTVDGDVTGSIHSTTTVIDKFRLVNPQTRQEENFQLTNYQVQVYDDQFVSVAWAIRKGKQRGRYFLVVNHTTHQQFFGTSDIREISSRTSALWFLIALPFPPVWLLAVLRGIIINIQVSRFQRSGVQPLVHALNQKAKSLAVT